MEEDIKPVREQRNKMVKEKGKGIVFRAKIQEMEEGGETCSSYFFKKSLGPKKSLMYSPEGGGRR